MSDARHDVFISYSSKDKTAADTVCAMLERDGISCWMAPRDISIGQDWAGSIIDAIGHARVFVLLFSQYSNASSQVRREVERAAHRELPILPFRLEDVAPNPTLEFFISSPHWLDAFDAPLEQHIQRLSASIQGFLARAVSAPQTPQVGQLHTARIKETAGRDKPVQPQAVATRETSIDEREEAAPPPSDQSAQKRDALAAETRASLPSVPRKEALVGDDEEAADSSQVPGSVIAFGGVERSVEAHSPDRPEKDELLPCGDQSENITFSTVREFTNEGHVHSPAATFDMVMGFPLKLKKIDLLFAMLFVSGFVGLFIFSYIRGLYEVGYTLDQFVYWKGELFLDGAISFFLISVGLVGLCWPFGRERRLGVLPIFVLALGLAAGAVSIGAANSYLHEDTGTWLSN